MNTNREYRAAARARLGGNIFGDTWLYALLPCLILYAISGVSAAIMPLILVILVNGPLSYGIQYIFLEKARTGEKIALGNLFKGFTDCFAPSFFIHLLTTIFTLLWGLLFVVPGIVKCCAYSQAYRIKMDHPDYEANECIKKSMQMMDGHKWQYFCLCLSFLGWYILGSLCFGVGVLWVTAYQEAAFAEFYCDLEAQFADGN